MGIKSKVKDLLDFPADTAKGRSSSKRSGGSKGSFQKGFSKSGGGRMGKKG